jgi:hypothetical protein
MKYHLPSFLFALGLIFITQGFAQKPSLTWAKTIGGPGFDFSPSLAVDAAGNVYTTGGFAGTADFDPGPNLYELTSAGNRDIFISKFDSAGNFVWAKKIGGGNIDQAYAITLDSFANVYITGDFNGTVDFDPNDGTYNLIPAEGSDIFIAKLDSSGNLAWAKNFGGALPDEVRSIALDRNGNVFSTGIFYNTVDFNPAAEIYNLTSAGAGDIFVSKLDSAGNFIWAKNMGGINSDFGNFITTDTAGNVYTTGYFTDTSDFDPAPGKFNKTSAGDRDIFISKLDSSGNFIWAANLGGIYTDIGLSVAVDAAQNVYTTGYFDVAGDFDPGPDVFDLTSNGNSDIFISKLDSSGHFVWAKQIGNTAKDFGFSIIVDTAQNVFTAGVKVAFEQPADENIFFTKLNAAGEVVWADSIGGSSKERAYSIALDTAGNIYMSGIFSGTPDFDPGSGTTNITSAGNYDVFVVKLGKAFVANTYTWTGNVDNDWNNAANWSCNCVPPPGSNVVIPASGTPALGSDIVVGNVTLQGSINLNGHTFTLNGTVTDTGNFIGSATSGMIINGKADPLNFAPTAARLLLLQVNEGASITIPEGTVLVLGEEPE